MEHFNPEVKLRRPSDGVLEVMTNDRQTIHIPSTLLAPLEPPKHCPSIKEKSTQIVERSSLRRGSKQALLQFVKEMNPAAIAEELRLDHAEVKAIKENNMFITDEDTSVDHSQTQHIAKLLDEIDRAKSRLLKRLDPGYDDLCQLLDEDTQHELEQSITKSALEHLRHVLADSPSRLLGRQSSDDIIKPPVLATHRHTKRMHSLSESIQALMAYTLSQWMEMTQEQQEHSNSSHSAIAEQIALITSKYRELQRIVETRHTAKPRLRPSQSMTELPHDENEDTAVLLVSKSVSIEQGEHRRFSKPSIVIPADDIELLEEDLFSASIEFGSVIGGLICDTAN